MRFHFFLIALLLSLSLATLLAQQTTARAWRDAFTLAPVWLADWPQVTPDAALADRIAATLDQKVVAVFFKSLPPLAPADDIAANKARFVAAVLPQILLVNQALARDRARLAGLRLKLASRQRLNRFELAWLARATRHYGVGFAEIDRLWRRLDGLPPSLILAQAAVESGWGASRFARTGNALFGQRVWGKDGMLPERRPADQRHRVRRFDDLRQAIYAYVHNLNTHRGYAALRGLRAQYRAAGEPLEGAALAAGLVLYSERGPDYVAQLRAMIRVNRFDDFDRARLGG